MTIWSLSLMMPPLVGLPGRDSPSSTITVFSTSRVIDWSNTKRVEIFFLLWDPHSGNPLYGHLAKCLYLQPYKFVHAGFEPGSFGGYNQLRDCMSPYTTRPPLLVFKYCVIIRLLFISSLQVYYYN